MIVLHHAARIGLENAEPRDFHSRKAHGLQVCGIDPLKPDLLDHLIAAARRETIDFGAVFDGVPHPAEAEGVDQRGGEDVCVRDHRAAMPADARPVEARQIALEDVRRVASDVAAVDRILRGDVVIDPEHRVVGPEEIVRIRVLEPEIVDQGIGITQVRVRNIELLHFLAERIEPRRGHDVPGKRLIGQRVPHRGQPG